MAIILGLLSAILWGSADFFARYATRLIGTYRTLFYMQFPGLVGLGIYLYAVGTFNQLSPMDSRFWQPWVWAVLAAILNVFSSLALYRAFEVGVLAVVSPIAAGSSALTVLLSFLSGEVISQERGIGIGAVMLGVILAATSFSSMAHSSDTELALRDKRKLTSGVSWALLAAVGYGVLFWILGFHVTPILGGIIPVWLVRLTTLCTLALLTLPLKQPLTLPRGPVWWYITAVAILDTLAFITATLALGNGQEVAIVSVLVSLFSAVTVVLAWIFLRDRLHWNQWLGIVVIFIGIVLVNL